MLDKESMIYVNSNHMTQTRKRTTYKSKNAADVLFNKAATVTGKDPKLYRKDPYGDVIKKDLYGKNVEGGWHKDHIKPPSKGGSDDIKNLQALSYKTNISKGDSLKKKSRHSKSNQ